MEGSAWDYRKQVGDALLILRIIVRQQAAVLSQQITAGSPQQPAAISQQLALSSQQPHRCQ